MYARCGALANAQQVLEELPVRNVVTWNALIAGYAQQGQGKEALKCFDRMQCDGHTPNAFTFTCVLKACGSIGAAAKGEEIHDKIASSGILKKNVVLGTALVDMYARCGVLVKAQQVLKELPVRDVVSWTALIAGYAQQGQGEEALECFDCMQCDGQSPNAVTFICALKACGSIVAAAKGKEIHDKIVNLGILGKNLMLGNALVDMYAKCGVLDMARQVLEELPVRDVVTWNGFLGGYAQQGQVEEAMKCLDDMQDDGHFPNTVTFICALKACSSIEATVKGEQIHSKIISFGMLEKSVVLGNAIVDMYARCGALTKAQQVLEELPVRDVVSWNALMVGYVQHGQGVKALKIFDSMQCDGHTPDAVTFTCALRACGSMGAAERGEQIHEKIVSLGMEKMCALGSAVVDMYARCGALAKAKQVLKELPIQDVVTWTALIGGYVQHGQGEEALKCFDDMQCNGCAPNAITFMCVSKACGSIGESVKGKQIHDEIVRLGMLEKNIMLGTALVDMYARCGAVAKAQQVLEELPLRSVSTWNALIAGYAQEGQGEKALICFDNVQRDGHVPNAISFTCALKACGSTGAAVKGEQLHDMIVRLGMLEKNIMLGSALVDMYARCGALGKAQELLEELPVRDVITWNSLIAGYVQEGQGEQALKCFEIMQEDGLSPNEITFISVLMACGALGTAVEGEEMHDKIVSLGMLERSIALGNALVDMYARCGAFAKARQVLEELPVQDVISWTALITRYAQVGQGEVALECFDNMHFYGQSPHAITFTGALKACGSIGASVKGEQICHKIISLGMLENSIVLGNALVDMYARCGALGVALQILEQLPVQDVVTWTALIAGFAHQEQVEGAVKCFHSMQHHGYSPTAVTFVCLLKACGSKGEALEGIQIHGKIVSFGMLEKYVVLRSALIDMYARCGLFDEAQQVFEKFPFRNAVMWNALMAGYIKQGQCQKALKCFDCMQHDGHTPDVYTLTCILKACGIIGAAGKGKQIHDKILDMVLLEKNFMIGNTLMDMYSRCGALAKAQQVLEELPVRDAVT